MPVLMQEFPDAYANRVAALKVEGALAGYVSVVPVAEKPDATVVEGVALDFILGTREKIEAGKGVYVDFFTPYAPEFIEQLESGVLAFNDRIYRLEWLDASASSLVDEMYDLTGWRRGNSPS
jgi:hypothetical protein